MHPPLRAALLLLLCFPWGCGQDGTPATPCSQGSCDQGSALADSGSKDARTPGGDRDVSPAMSCVPGRILSCDPENTPGLRRCNALGSGEEVGMCAANEVCRQGQCVAVACIPGERFCSRGAPKVCDQEGAEFELQDACVIPEQCEDGVCLDRCALARRNRSYIGCEYWAVELENHLLYDEPLVGGDLPPFGVVLTNPSDTYDARVTVLDGQGQVAHAVASREVGVDRVIPGIQYQTVHSELVDAKGTLLKRISGPLQDIPLPRGALLTLLLPHQRIPFGASSLGNFGYKVSTTHPVVATQFNPLCCNYNTTNDASLLLPESALTGNYTYLGYAVFAGTPTRRLATPYSATLTVVATQDDTEVEVVLQRSKDPERPAEALLYPWTPGAQGRVRGPDTSGRVSVTMKAFEVLNLGSKGAGPVEDLTGTRVRATKPVAVFSGHSCAFVPYTLGFCDHIESQLFPMETWGRVFLATPLKLRNPAAAQDATREATYWKIVAGRDGTRVLTGIDLRPRPGGVLQPADEGVASCASKSAAPEMGVVELETGESCEVGTREPMVVQSNHPISIGAFLSGQDSVFQNASPGDRAGDPAFFFLPPEEQYRSSYTILTPRTYFQNWATVTILKGFELRLNGQALDLAGFDTQEIPQRQYIRVHIPIKEGPQVFESAAPFGIIIYGYDDYVSYAYTGGLNLRKLSNAFE